MTSACPMWAIKVHRWRTRRDGVKQRPHLLTVGHQQLLLWSTGSLSPQMNGEVLTLESKERASPDPPVTSPKPPYRVPSSNPHRFLGHRSQGGRQTACSKTRSSPPLQPQNMTTHKQKPNIPCGRPSSAQVTKKHSISHVSLQTPTFIQQDIRPVKS